MHYHHAHPEPEYDLLRQAEVKFEAAVAEGMKMRARKG
jgi:hypothetical protein